jgi:hypothetical protein
MAKGREKAIMTLRRPIKIMFDENRNYSQGLKIPFKRNSSLLERCVQDCVHNLELTKLSN